MQTNGGLSPKQQSEVKKMIECALLGFKASLSDGLSLLNELVQAPQEKKQLDQSPIWLRVPNLDTPKALPNSSKSPINKENVIVTSESIEIPVEPPSKSNKPPNKVVAEEPKRFAKGTSLIKRGSTMSKVKLSLEKNERKFESPIKLSGKRMPLNVCSTQSLKNKKIIPKQ